MLPPERDFWKAHSQDQADLLARWGHALRQIAHSSLAHADDYVKMAKETARVALNKVKQEVDDNAR